MEVYDAVRRENGMTELPQGLIGEGPEWNGFKTYECLICGGEHYRDMSLEGTVQHLEQAHGVMLGSQVVESPILGSDGKPIKKTVAASLFSRPETNETAT